MKKLRYLTVAEEEDYFGRLPDDVIIDIFGRVNDSAEFLIQCLLLSKRIASLIRFVTSVSIKIQPSDVEKYNPRPTHRDTILSSNSVCFRFTLINPSQRAGFADSWNCTKWPCSLDEMVPFYICNAREGLHPFSRVKSAIIQHTNFNYTHVDKGMRWWLEYSGGVNKGGIIKSCSFLGRLDHYRAISQLGCSTMKNKILNWVVGLFHTAFTFYPMVAQVAHDHESLCDILVTTTPRKGWFHAGEDEIVKMRQDGSRSADDVIQMMLMMEEEMCMKVKAWFVNLPGKSSTYVFVVVSSPDNIDQEVKAAMRSDWGYRKGAAVIETTNMRELVETMPCHLEFDWVTHFEGSVGRC